MDRVMRILFIDLVIEEKVLICIIFFFFFKGKLTFLMRKKG